MTDPQQQALPPIPAKFPSVWVPMAGAFIDISIHLREAIENRDDEWRAALAASAPSREVPGWMPIETAPKDGKDLLVFTTDQLVRLAFFDRAREGVWSCWPGRERIYPTHWIPLPAAPSPSVAAEETKP